MFSGADLAAIINEAALAATMANKDSIEMSDLEEARDKVRWGRAKKSRVIDQKEREITAYHEAGHTLVQCLIKDADPLHKVSIIPRGPMGGATFALPEKDRTMFTRRYCNALLQVCFSRTDRRGVVLRRHLQRRPVRYRAGHEDRPADGPDLGHERPARPHQLRAGRWA